MLVTHTVHCNLAGVSHSELYYPVVLSISLSGGCRWAMETRWEIKPGTFQPVFKQHTGFVKYLVN